MTVKGCRDTKLSGVIPVEGTEPTARALVRAGKAGETEDPISMVGGAP